MRFAKDLLYCAIIIAVCLAVGLGRYRCDINLGDEGFLAYGAVRVQRGDIPNRDFFSLQPPLSFYTTAAVFKLMGASLVSMRLFGLFIYVVIAVLIYALARQLITPIGALAAALPASILTMPLFNFTPYAVWQGTLAALVAAILFIRAAKKNSTRLAFAAGIATTAAILLRHDMAFYLSIAIILYGAAILCIKNKFPQNPSAGKLLGFWMLGIAVLILPVIFLLIICGAAPAMFRQLIIFPLTKYAVTSSIAFPRFDLTLPAQHNLLTAMFFLPPLVVTIAVLYLFYRLIRRRFGTEQCLISFIVFLSAFLYCQALTRSDIYHLLPTLPPFFVLCSALLTIALNSILQAAKKSNTTKKFLSNLTAALVVFLTLIIAAVFLLGTVSYFLKPAENTTRPLQITRGGVYLEQNYADTLEQIIKLLQKYAPPDQSILCVSYQPMFYFLAGRHNPTAWDYFWPGDQTQQDFELFIEQAKADPPAAVVTTQQKYIESFAPSVIQYINTNYKLAHSVDAVKIYTPENVEKYQVEDFHNRDKTSSN